jgi:hypothetical protein
LLSSLPQTSPQSLSPSPASASVIASWAICSNRECNHLLSQHYYSTKRGNLIPCKQCNCKNYK